MKSIKEIQYMLVTEFHSNLNKLRDLREISGYYNEIMDETSYMLADLLASHLKKEFDNWHPKKWIDDCLFTMAKLENNILSIWGVMIWGIEDSESSDQFTEPFYYEIELNKPYFNKYTFLFGDQDNPEISYDTFRFNRDYWRKGDGSNDWSPAERKCFRDAGLQHLKWQDLRTRGIDIVLFAGQEFRRVVLPEWFYLPVLAR